MSVSMYLPGFNTNSLTPYFTVNRDEKLLNSISSTKETHSAAYELDFSTHYQSIDEACAASNNIYYQTSIYRANLVDTHMYTYHDTTRSITTYANANDYFRNDSVASAWSDFSKDKTYQKMLAQGGTKSQDDVNELLAAAESYIWQRAYTENGVYKDDMFDFADKLKNATGVTVITQANDDVTNETNNLGFSWDNSNRLTFGLDGSLCRMDNYTFQAMAKHQDHMDIWENALNGTYSSFADITAAVLSTDDDSLKKDWLSAITDGSKVNTDDFTKEDNQTVLEKYVSVSLPRNSEGYTSSNAVGTTAKDFWNEFNYNTYMTNNYSTNRDYKDFYDGGFVEMPYSSVSMHTLSQLRDKAGIPRNLKIDDEGNTYDGDTGKLYETANDREARFAKNTDNGSSKSGNSIDDQIDALQDKIKNVRKKISALKSAGNDETQNRNLAVYQKQLDTYKEQLAELQSEKLAKAKLDIMA